MTGLRDRLRAETAESHNRIDRRMGALDLTTVNGLSQMLGAHYLVQSLFERSLPERNALGFVPHLEADLEALGLDLPIWTDAPAVSDEDPLGYRYVVSGSQLGARLLYREWSTATDPRVQSASRYMTANRDSRVWRDFLEDIAHIHLSPEAADAVVASANRVFQTFDLAATRMGGAPA